MAVQSTGTSSVIYDALAKDTTMIMPDEDVTLTAVINPPEGTYMVSFDFNNEQEEYTYRRTDTNGKLNDLPTATRTDYTFDGWFTAVDGGEKITTESIFAEDTTVYAHWTKNVTPPVTKTGYKITFDANGGTASSTELTTDENGKLNSLPTASRTDYTFDGWFTAVDGGKKITTESVFAEDTTVYAHWTKNVTPPVTETGYKITFDANGGTASSTELTTDETGKLSNLPTATRTDYTFDGWFTAADSGEKITTETVFTEDTTVYAHWTKKVTPPVTEIGYKITFNANGGTASSTELTTDKNGKLSNLPTATRTDFTFDGWFTAADGGDKITSETVFTEDTTVYAHWTKRSDESENLDDSNTPDTSVDESSSGTDDNVSTDNKTSDSGTSGDSSAPYSDSELNNEPNSTDGKNPSTGVSIAIIPMLFAAGASIVIFSKRTKSKTILK